MKTYRFKTNAKCGGCVAAIGAVLNRTLESGQWNIDLASPDKILTVTADLSPEKIVEMVEEAGFRAEKTA